MRGRGEDQTKPSIRCLEDLIKALDETACPPQTDADFEVWVKRWRKIEAAWYSSPQEGERQAQVFITVHELRSIMATRKFRRARRQKVAACAR